MNEKNIPILYEDKYVLVINKPAGIAVHRDGRSDEYTIADWVVARYPETKNVGEPARYLGKEVARPGIVHRLDKDTSGVLAIAKTQEAFDFLKKQFQGRTTKKCYRAFVYGTVEGQSGVIEKPIGRSMRDFRQWSAERGARGTMREAVTKYKVLKRGIFIKHSVFDKNEKDERFSYLELSPKTGRTHQIRVHLKSINHPIVCDKLYAPKRPCALGFERLALHAFSIEFSLPDNSYVSVEAPLPNDFETAVALLE
ncbi:MAG: RluA family pseudouridine synthase [Patescibacteria group bacterium]